MEKEPYFGIASPEATERAFQRWFAFMLFPGFGWIGLAAFFVLPIWAAALIAYLTVYAAFAFAWPGTFALFWRELGKAAPGALRDAAMSLVRLAIWIALRVRDFCRAGATFLASIGAPIVAAMNIAISERKRAKPRPEPRADVHHRLVGVEPIETQAPEEPRAPEHVAPRRTRIDWGKLASALVNPRFWVFVLICIAIISLARCADGFGPFKPSGREVAAENRAETAEVNQAVAEHERQGAVQGAQRAEQTHAADRASRAIVRRAQEENNDALQQLPGAVGEGFFADLNARYHDAYERVWSDTIVGPSEPDLPPAGPGNLLAS